LALELIVPPLSLLAVLLVLMFVVSSVAAALGLASTALIISAICIVAFAIAVVLAWSKYGRVVLSPRAVLSIP